MILTSTWYIESCCSPSRRPRRVADRTNPVRSSYKKRKITPAVGFVRPAGEIHGRCSILPLGNFTVDGGEERSIQSKRELRRPRRENIRKVGGSSCARKSFALKKRRPPSAVVCTCVCRGYEHGRKAVIAEEEGGGWQKVKRSMRTR